MQGVTGNGKVVAEAGRHKVLVKDSEDRTWVTVVECVSASGVVVLLLVIFPGKSV